MLLEQIVASIEAQIPRSLDDIITKNREFASQYSATKKQVAALQKTIPHPGDQLIKKSINDWRLVTLDIKHAGEVARYVRLLGYHDEARGCCTLTSPILGIDLGTGIVVTRSGSFYRLVGPCGQGEPTLFQLLLVCADFHNVGYGRFFGVPHVYY